MHFIYLVARLNERLPASIPNVAYYSDGERSIGNRKEG